jgi:hypothetical protein
MDAKKKYLKYKQKYLSLKKLRGGANENLEFFLNFNSKKNEILTKYENFTNFTKMQVPFRPIGSPSSNGFINLINYQNNVDANTFDTIMKTSQRLNADNNFYEFNIGLCVNAMKQYFPNFVYTFLYFNSTLSLITHLSPGGAHFNNLPYFIANTQNVRSTSVPLIINQPDYENACVSNNRASVLIENVPNSITLLDLIIHPDFNTTPEIYNYNLFNILFQIYAALSSLKNVYTHYDLHTSNIMYVELPNIKKIIYKINDRIYTILTKFIPVIIDYGRSYIDCSILGPEYSSIVKSRDYANNTINPSCNESLNLLDIEFENYSLKLKKYGPNNYGITHDNWSNRGDRSYISPRVNNKSSDMRYINLICNRTTYYMTMTSDICTQYRSIFNNINNPEWNGPSYYGAKEQPSEAGKIKNIGDVMEFLINYYNRNYIDNVPIVPVGNKNLIIDTININCNLAEKIKWSYKTQDILQVEEARKYEVGTKSGDSSCVIC